MDWSLVLASQDIAAIINRTETGWELIVDRPDYERAKAVLSQYQIENRGWRWRRELPGTGVVFHWGGVLWALGMAAFYYWSMVRSPWLKSAGMVDSQAVLRGQWWRLFTAVTLHENLPHLSSNAVTGFLLLGLAMARYGPGLATLAAFLAGAAGNFASVMIDPAAHESLGASGMVTGALGLITVQSFAPWRKYRAAASFLPRAVAAGVLILVLIGFSPGTDTVAHVGGFLAGGDIGAGAGLGATGRAATGGAQRGWRHRARGLGAGNMAARQRWITVCGGRWQPGAPPVPVFPTHDVRRRRNQADRRCLTVPHIIACDERTLGDQWGRPTRRCPVPEIRLDIAPLGVAVPIWPFSRAHCCFAPSIIRRLSMHTLV